MQDCPADYSDNYRDEQCKSHGDKWMAIGKDILHNMNMYTVEQTDTPE